MGVSKGGGKKRRKKNTDGEASAKAVETQAPAKAEAAEEPSEERGPDESEAPAKEEAKPKAEKAPAKKAAPAPASRGAGKTPFDLSANRREMSAQLIHEADAIKGVSVYFEDETFVTYEGSRIPWWVRLMWIGFWLMAFFYVANYLWPDAQRYFGA